MELVSNGRSDRNRLIFEGRFDEPKEVVVRTGRLLGDFLICNGLDKIAKPKQVVSKHKWKVPKHGSVKLNVDAAIIDALGFIGECLAVRKGAWFVLSRRFSKWIVKTDGLNVYKAVYSPIQRSVEANVIDDIRDSCLQVGSGSVCYGSREGNSIAYFLARLAVSNSCYVLSKILNSFVRTDIIDLE
ncbi:hypothetical protein TIFTF001_031327 [Ficus carica]|uniref:RNase H type-1 domain-containing protein n=1 Tax=Ficus carica TaxID=3494 RepID=A0AA88DW69_FICCA|nr:hypothetical protein TIFTF001_031327 [Ficus carica]